MSFFSCGTCGPRKPKTEVVFTSTDARALLQRADTPRTKDLKNLKAVGESWYAAAQDRGREVEQLKAELAEAERRKLKEQTAAAAAERELAELQATMRRQTVALSHPSEPPDEIADEDGLDWLTMARVKVLGRQWAKTQSDDDSSGRIRKGASLSASL